MCYYLKMQRERERERESLKIDTLKKILTTVLILTILANVMDEDVQNTRKGW